MLIKDACLIQECIYCTRDGYVLICLCSFYTTYTVYHGGLMIVFLSLTDNDEDKIKLENMYNRYSKRMFYVAMDILKNEYDAEDAVHNTFISIAVNMDKINDIRSEETYYYVMTITENTALNLLKKKKGESRKTINLDFEDDSWLFVSDIDIAEEFVSKEEYNRIVDIIQSLPDIYSDVLYLHYVENLTAREIASALSRKQETVRKQIVRGKKMLIHYLRKEGMEND